MKMKPMTPLSLEELATAPFRFTRNALIRAPIAAVFAELGDPSRWFPMMKSSTWHGRVGGVGSQREVQVQMFGTFRESMLAWVPDARVAFTMTHSTSPLVARLGEDFSITRDPSGQVRIDWTMSADLTTLGRVAEPVLRVILGRMFAMFVPRLERAAAAAEPLRGTPTS